VRRPALAEPGLAQKIFQGTRGEKGKWTEILARGEYTLSCESSEGNDNILRLFGVEANYTENPAARGPSQRALVWHITAPTATHEASGSVDTLDGPLFIQVKDINGKLLGSGKSDYGGPALRRENDVWHGLAPLRWTHVDELGKGEYLLPAGWRKEKDDRFVAERGPVVWNSTGTDLVRSIKADSLDARDLMAGTMTSVNASLEGESALGGGEVWAEAVEVDGGHLRFSAPIKFEHRQGWRGTAASGAATRQGGDQPKGGSQSHGALELIDFSASGVLAQEATKGGPPKIDVRQAKANEAVWTGSSLQMLGDVKWDLEITEKGGSATRYLLSAPTAFYSPALGAIRSEGRPALSWGGRTLNSDTMAYLVREQAWHLEGQVHGTVPGGIITAGPASGSASDWSFSGPIRADYQRWGAIVGDRLVWAGGEAPSYIFTGSPSVFTGAGHRLSGQKIVHSGDKLQFPSGIQGTITFQGETFTLRADRAEITQGGDAASRGVSIEEVRLRGRVECSAKSYRFASREATITFENNQPKRILASGGTSLQGSLGGGAGDSIEIVFEQGSAQPSINWLGQVRGKVDVPLGR
jgi:hypothetical protein